MVMKHIGPLPLCWQVCVQKRGQFGTTVKGPYTFRKAQRVATMAEWQGERANIEEIADATARHRAIINARRSA